MAAVALGERAAVAVDEYALYDAHLRDLLACRVCGSSTPDLCPRGEYLLERALTASGVRLRDEGARR